MSTAERSIPQPGTGRGRGLPPAGAPLLLTLALLVALCLPGQLPSLPGRIAFQTDRDGNWEIYVMNPDGSGQARLTDHPAEDWLPRWLPAPAGAPGSYVVFVSNREGDWHLYLLDVDAARRSSPQLGPEWGLHRPQEGLARNDGFLAGASAVGERLAAILERARRGQPVRLTGETGDNWDPAPSPDGRRLAFSALSGGQRDVFLLDLETGETANLTRHPADDWLPAWAPGGGRLAFVSDRDGNMEIYLLDLESGQEANLTRHPADDWVPVWSPDPDRPEGRIAFQSYRDGNWEIYLLDPASGAQTNLTNHPADDWDPAWSPHAGTGAGRLAFMSWRDGNREVYVMEVGGAGTTRRLTNNPAADKNPAWLP